LSQRAVRIRGLPATHQIELVGQAVEHVAFCAKIPDRLGWLPVSDSDVEVTAQHQVCAAAKHRHPVKNVLHRTDVSAFAHGPVNAENDYGPI
jgi:hypothetical protein